MRTGEPPHIHIHRDAALVNFWLRPVSLVSSTRFSAKEVRELQKLVEENKVFLLEVWDEYFAG